MNTTTVVVTIAVALAVLAVGMVVVVGSRVNRLRNSGTAVLLRPLPAGPDQGWRHGIVRYDDNTMVFYRLSSLRTGPSEVIARQSIETRGRRRPQGTEVDVIDAMTIVEIGADGADYELAMAPGAITAFQSWVESRPPVRSQRRRSA
ncbi:hypothetical protein ASG12_14565 [Williamsia sp. Leaf354]|uniref:DUF2550 domain-containing protein n=1 Tax=Williamsia herbipolensis TaxID=1603258 RepID=A0AAU4K2J0_9NOCA|nr:MULTISPECIES: DUF2550 domain-containing protein [Williamsia]KQR97590.1 hypothetical protein ASG12_14565 [Williamsia sp. Leaf354]MCX6471822.1 DUF2550 domain-containing protein [Mycobacteriales bacterium]